MQPVQKKATLALCLIFSLCTLVTPTNARAVTPTQAGLTAASIALAVSIYKHLQTLPEDRPNLYDTPEFHTAVRELKCGKNVKKNLVIIANYSPELWEDGFCGHASKVGSPRFNDKTGRHEIPYIESRGVLGWVSDKIDPIKKTASIATEAVVVAGTVAVGFKVWKAFVMNDIKAKEAISKFVDSLCSKNPILCSAEEVKQAKEVTATTPVYVVQPTAHSDVVVETTPEATNFSAYS